LASPAIVQNVKYKNPGLTGEFPFSFSKITGLTGEFRFAMEKWEFTGETGIFHGSAKAAT
jgi:hypothetical protein